MTLIPNTPVVMARTLCPQSSFQQLSYKPVHFGSKWQIFTRNVLISCWFWGKLFLWFCNLIFTLNLLRYAKHNTNTIATNFQLQFLVSFGIWLNSLAACPCVVTRADWPSAFFVHFSPIYGVVMQRNTAWTIGKDSLFSTFYARFFQDSNIILIYCTDERQFQIL